MANKTAMRSVECDCGMDVFGSSERHAEQNLKIHKNISRKHREFLSMKRKWLKSGRRD
jgi:hypothetical protein